MKCHNPEDHNLIESSNAKYKCILIYLRVFIK